MNSCVLVGVVKSIDKDNVVLGVKNYDTKQEELISFDLSKFTLPCIYQKVKINDMLCIKASVHPTELGLMLQAEQMTILYEKGE